MHEAMSSSPTNPTATRSTPREVRRVAFSGFIGNLIEYYDFLLYGSAAALVFSRLFFSDLSPALGLVASFGTLATGYVARPLGGILFGYIGDRYGRKRSLLITIWMMGLASGTIGLLPTFDQIGALAPVLLVTLRLIQGLAVGGEWGGSALLTAEHASDGRRGFVTGLGQAGLPAGGVLATFAMASVASLPDAQLFSWGWRVPFLFSFVLLAFAVYIRSRVSESPLFVEMSMKQPERAVRTPITTAFKAHPKALLRGVFVSVPPSLAGSLIGSFAVSYAVSVGHNRSTVLIAVGVAFGISVFTTSAGGWLSDRVGRKPVYMGGAIMFGILAFPIFWMINTLSPILLFVSFAAAFALASSMMASGLAAILSEFFPTETRYLSVSISYQAGAIIAGLTPIISAALLAAAGGGTNTVGVSLFILGIAVSALAAIMLSRESQGSSLRRVTEDSKIEQTAPVRNP